MLESLWPSCLQIGQNGQHPAVAQPIQLVAAVVVPSRWLAVFVGWGMTTLICTLVATHIWRTRDDDWDLPPVR